MSLTIRIWRLPSPCWRCSWRIRMRFHGTPSSGSPAWSTMVVVSPMPTIWDVLTPLSKSTTALRILRTATPTPTLASTTAHHLAIYNHTRTTLISYPLLSHQRCSVSTRTPISATRSKNQTKSLKLCSQSNREFHQLVVDWPLIKSCFRSKSNFWRLCLISSTYPQARKNSLRCTIICILPWPLCWFRRLRSSTEC